MANKDTNNLSSITVDFTLNKPLDNFNLDIINAMNLTKSQLLKIDDLNYNVKFELINQGAISYNQIFIDADAIEDKYGNKNSVSNKFIWNSDTLKPKIIDIYASIGETRYMHNVGYEIQKAILNY